MVDFSAKWEMVIPCKFEKNVGYGKKNFLKTPNFDARPIFGPDFGFHAPLRDLKMAITPKLIDSRPSNFTTLLPLTSSNKKLMGDILRNP